MDEYFCPNCGATLNDQYGFDPSCGTWTCTVCGKLLMDDDVYDGDSFEGVAWFCDGCGALLNRQSGFSDSYGSWICTECAHRNGTTENDIIDDSFSCPKCGATLNDQWGFNKYNDDHECSSCGAKLHHSYSDDKYSVVEEETGPECPNCGARLKDQFCFADYQDNWTCTECGAHLHHSYSSDPYTIVEEDKGPECPNCGAYLKEQYGFSDYEDDWECSECGAHLHHDYSSDPYEIVDADDDSANDDDDSSSAYYTPPVYTPPRSDYSGNTSKEPSNQPRAKKTKRLPDSELRKIRVKAFLFKRKKIQIKYDYSDLLGRDYTEIETLLYNQAFNNIKVIPIKDIYVGSPYRIGQVEQVVIAGSSFFQEGDTIPYDAEIVVTYHAKREITLPFGEKELRKLDYVTAGDKL